MRLTLDEYRAVKLVSDWEKLVTEAGAFKVGEDLTGFIREPALIAIKRQFNDNLNVFTSYYKRKRPTRHYSTIRVEDAFQNAIDDKYLEK